MVWVLGELKFEGYFERVSRSLLQAQTAARSIESYDEKEQLSSS